MGKKVYDHDRMMELSKSGCSDAEVARQIGCHESWVKKVRHRRGVSPAFPNRQAGALSVPLRRLLAEQTNASNNELAKAVGCSPDYIRAFKQRERRYGV